METLLNKIREESGAEARRSAAELTRLRTSLQAESLHRHRLESEALAARGKIGEAERAAASALGRVQQRLRTPVLALVQSIGRVLEQELSPEQRQFVEGVLANAAMVQTSLHDLGSGLNARRQNASAVPAAGAEESVTASPVPGNGGNAHHPGFGRVAPTAEMPKQP